MNEKHASVMTFVTVASSGVKRKILLGQIDRNLSVQVGDLI